jgi:hypothetical protein
MVSVKVGLEKWGGKAKDALLDKLNLLPSHATGGLCKTLPGV